MHGAGFTLVLNLNAWGKYTYLHEPYERMRGADLCLCETVYDVAALQVKYKEIYFTVHYSNKLEGYPFLHNIARKLNDDDDDLSVTKYTSISVYCTVDESRGTVWRTHSPLQKIYASRVHICHARKFGTHTHKLSRNLKMAER